MNLEKEVLRFNVVNVESGRVEMIDICLNEINAMLHDLKNGYYKLIDVEGFDEDEQEWVELG